MASESDSKNSSRKKGVPLYILLIIFVIWAPVSLYLVKEINEGKRRTAILENPQQCLTTMKRVSATGYKYAHPLILTDVEKEADALLPLKGDIMQMISDFKTSGSATSVAVYLRKQYDAKWISINGEEGFSPGSLMKVPCLITYLAMAEKDSNILQRKISFQHPMDVASKSSFAEEAMPAGKDYSIGQLLYYMAVKSDKDATTLLFKQMDEAMFRKLFTDIGMPEANYNDENPTITAPDYSKFIRLLYSASYLTWEHSEYALELLSQSSFNKGLTKDLPHDIIVAHDYGERSDGSSKQLHETAIVYVNGDPYLLTVMTKGNDVNKLAGVMSSISKLVFDRLKVTGMNSADPTKQPDVHTAAF